MVSDCLELSNSFCPTYHHGFIYLSRYSNPLFLFHGYYSYCTFYFKFRCFCFQLKKLNPTTLDYTNYMLWRELFVSVLKGQSVYDFINGSHSCLEPTLTVENGTSTINFVFQQ
ncbi:hypothetical protein RDI58_013546 [Solanum bulbocastanum]|uniref:Retrotransposon Copia-like N-terminal domain-containing protein n=1 Tax=Solanum bulbocastanum TaxID=147425 RepID=A0AAN8YFB9_SOLBU